MQEGDYEIEIGGILFPAEVRLNSPVLPSRIRRASTKGGRDAGGATQYEDRSSSYDYEHAAERKLKRDFKPRMSNYDHLEDEDEKPKFIPRLSNYDYLDDDDDEH